MGLVGLVTSRSTNADCIVLSDGCAEVVEKLYQNVELNECTNLKVLQLQWESESLVPDLMVDNVDVILATDCVYDPDLIPPLVTALDRLVTAFPQAHCFLSVAIRNPETFQLLMDTIDSKLFKVERLEGILDCAKFRLIHDYDPLSITILYLKRN